MEWQEGYAVTPNNKTATELITYISDYNDESFLCSISYIDLAEHKYFIFIVSYQAAL